MGENQEQSELRDLENRAAFLRDQVDSAQEDSIRTHYESYQWIAQHGTPRNVLEQIIIRAVFNKILGDYNAR